MTKAEALDSNYSVSRFGVGAILYGCPINKRGIVGLAIPPDKTGLV